MTYKQKLVVMVMDVLIFIELTYSIIKGKNDLENMTAVFFLNFIPLFLITFISGKILLKRLAVLEPQTIEAENHPQQLSIESNYDTKPE